MRKRVYCVLKQGKYDPDAQTLEAVFSTKEKAEDYINRHENAADYFIAVRNVY